MKIKVVDQLPLQEIEVEIKCQERDDTVERIVDLVSMAGMKISGKIDGETVLLELNDIYYFEAVENKVFAYIAKEVYEVSYKINDLLDMLRLTAFVQVSRVQILNINKIQKISSLVNGRIQAILDNDEMIIITRVYAKDFKQKLKA